MQNSTELTKAKRTLLEKYLRGDVPQSAAAVQAIPRRSTTSRAPLSFGQEQLWFLAQLMPASPVYNESLSISLSGSLDVAALEQGLNEFIKRHESWRTTFPSIDGQPVQVIQPASPLKLSVVDLCNLPITQRQDEALQLATAKAMQPFDLARGPLLRAMLVRLDDDDYCLFMTLHHIIFDAVSINQIFLPELNALYEFFAHGKPLALSSAPIEYADFATWEREALGQDTYAKHLAYWKQQLAAVPPVLDLPSDRPRPPVQSYRGSMRTFALPRQLTDALKTLSRQENVTLYMTLTAAFQAFLHRYTGQDDLLLGTVTSSRKRPEVQNVVGYFLNTVVLRTDLSGNPTFLELLKRVCNVIISARHYEDMPFDALVKELQPERSLSYQPLVQVFLSFHPPLLTLPSGWTLSQMDVQTHTSIFDLCLELDDRPQGLIGRFKYNTDLFDEATIARMLTHWQTLLEGIVADPSRRLAELPLLSEAERRMLLVEWNTSALQQREDQCIHQLFEAQVERTPDAVAVVCENEHLTYQQLNRQANQLARYLQVLGVGPEVLVGICMERSLEMVVGLLGVLKAGGAYVPLDPTYPKERLAFMIEDTRVAVLLTQQRLAVGLAEYGGQLICLDAGKQMLSQQSEANLRSGVDAQHLAYVIYTSSSTGKPKGVQITHRSLLNLVFWHQRTFEVQASDRATQFASPAFDVTGEELWPHLVCGASVYLIDADVRFHPEAMRDWLVNSGITITILPTALAESLIALEWPETTSLRVMLTGGDTLHRYPPHTLPFALINNYGPSETTVVATSGRVFPNEDAATPPSIGRPVANAQIYILDEQLTPVPIGVAGELYIGGAGLARGYLKRPDLTAERFIPHPFSVIPGARLYKTGDRARYRADGVIEFLGRKDHQVKLRGVRIELGEIEAMLRQLPEVQQTVVVAREDAPGNKRLVAYIVALPGQQPSTSYVREALQKKLPEYMLPATFVFLDTLLLTANGKLDHRALPVPQPARLTGEESFVAPKLLVHHQLVQIWEELLDKRPLGIRDNFFHLGGHSLLAARLVARMEQVLGKKISLSTLFSEPTVEQLVRALQQQGDSYSCTPLLAVQASGSKRPFFFLHGDWTGGAFYCFALARALGADQPFYVLEPYKFAGLQVLPTLEAIAATHLESLRAVQPEGPYQLGGFCNGGLVAYEMARQLRAAGQEVELQLLINPSSPLSARVLSNMTRRLGRLMRLGADKQGDWFLRVRHALRHVYRFLRPSDSRLEDFPQLVEIDQRLNSMFPPVEALYKDYVGVFTWLAAGYDPGIYADKITFFWADEEPFIQEEWRPILEAKVKGEIENHVVPGTHMSCVTVYVQDVAERLRMCLSRI